VISDRGGQCASSTRWVLTGAVVTCGKWWRRVLGVVGLCVLYQVLHVVEGSFDPLAGTWLPIVRPDRSREHEDFVPRGWLRTSLAIPLRSDPRLCLRLRTHPSCDVVVCRGPDFQCMFHLRAKVYAASVNPGIACPVPSGCCLPGVVCDVVLMLVRAKTHFVARLLRWICRFEQLIVLVA
jgi:hypothetical protein